MKCNATSCQIPLFLLDLFASVNPTSKEQMILWNSVADGFIGCDSNNLLYNCLLAEPNS